MNSTVVATDVLVDQIADEVFRIGPVVLVPTVANVHCEAFVGTARFHLAIRLVPDPNRRVLKVPVVIGLSGDD